MPKEKLVKAESQNLANQTEFSELFDRVQAILESARKRVARTVNTEMVQAYWLIGQAIVEEEQKGKKRADYGKRLIESLAKKMKAKGFKGFGVRNLAWMRDFYHKFSNLHALRAELSWTHYRLILKVRKEEAREFYEAEAVAGNWSTRELSRQISASVYERTRHSKDKSKKLEEKRKSGEKYKPQDFVKDPYILEFLNLKDTSGLNETKLEEALLDHLQDFLLEMGKGFSFVARQKRITIDGDHFYIDLVLYNRLLRCFVLIELKTKKLTQGDIGQIMLYTNYYTRERIEDWENPTIGILLCAEKNDAMVRYTLPENEEQIFASRFQDFFPTEEELAEEIERQKTALLQLKSIENK